ncbi:MAG TPA: hypothetical protein VI282_12355 [Verrucomicrobiae bacterium]|jgi:hypothetical protein
MRLLMTSLDQSNAIQKRRRNATGETTGVRAVVWAIAAFAFLGLVCVVAWKTDSFKAFGELFGGIEHMSQTFHLILMALGAALALVHWARGGSGRKS